MEIDIPGYSVQGKLGRGGMAVVYLAVQRSLHRQVALKVLRPGYADDPQYSARFLDEGRILASLNHVNIITIHDIGVHRGRHYISMEYVDGIDLASEMFYGVSVERALAYVETIARCLDHAHRNGIVHRDIKPSNILFRKDGSLLLSDFGIAKRLHGGPGLTSPGMALGSPNYVSPEQARGVHTDGRGDIYSVGIMLYEMLTGSLPYTGETDLDTVIQHLTSPIPRLPDGLKTFQPLIDRMIAKQASERFASAGELLDHLRALRQPGVLSTTTLRARVPVRAARRNLPATAINDHPPVADSGETLVNPEFGERPVSFRRPTLATAASAALLTMLAIVLFRPSADPDALPQEPTVTARADTGTPADSGDRLAAIRSHPGRSQPLPEHQAGLQPPAPTAISTSATSDGIRRAGDALNKHVADTRIESLLALAALAIDEYRLTTPGEDSAFGYFSAVLALDADNRQARRGVEQIAERYADLADRALTEGNRRRAYDYIATGLAVNPGNRRLSALADEARRGWLRSVASPGVETIHNELPLVEELVVRTEPPMRATVVESVDVEREIGQRRSNGTRASVNALE